ncbi:hypothetical protein [uncultured Pseudomonas sp.]|uniref:hypothetical protein n=1 Tax=uncultured Pseudomonas sp. TaxID=114707 RepID=UPI0025DEE5EA|nr:hypothetical protein [uncultured Pseudomonas sp.]
MSRYIKERSFVASLRAMAPYEAQLDFSRQVEERGTVVQGNTAPPVFIRSDEYAYLSATTQPRETLKFWFLWRSWDNASESYEIKARHAMFVDNRQSLGNLTTTSQRVAVDPFNFRDVMLYIRPEKALKSNPGWHVLLNDKLLDETSLRTGEVGPVQIIAPNGNPLGVYDRRNFGQQWWAYISCARSGEPLLSANTVPIRMMMTVEQIAIDDPLA